MTLTRGMRLARSRHLRVKLPSAIKIGLEPRCALRVAQDTGPSRAGSDRGYSKGLAEMALTIGSMRGGPAKPGSILGSARLAGAAVLIVAFALALAMPARPAAADSSCPGYSV